MVYDQMHTLASATGKAGVSAKLSLDFPAFPIHFIELSRPVATMRFVGRVPRALARWISTGQILSTLGMGR